MQWPARLFGGAVKGSAVLPRSGDHSEVEIPVDRQFDSGLPTLPFGVDDSNNDNTNNENSAVGSAGDYVSVTSGRSRLSGAASVAVHADGGNGGSDSLNAATVSPMVTGNGNNDGVGAENVVSSCR